MTLEFNENVEYFGEQLRNLLYPTRRQILFHSLTLNKDLSDSAAKGLSVNCVSLTGMVFAGILIKERNTIVFASNKNLIGFKPGHVCIFSFRFNNEDCFIQSHIKEAFTNKLVLIGTQLRKYPRYSVVGCCDLSPVPQEFVTEVINGDFLITRVHEIEKVNPKDPAGFMSFEKRLEDAANKNRTLATLSGLGGTRGYLRPKNYRAKELIFDKLTKEKSLPEEYFYEGKLNNGNVLDLSLNGCAVLVEDIPETHPILGSQSLIFLQSVGLLDNQKIVLSVFACAKSLFKTTAAKPTYRIGCQFLSPLSAKFPIPIIDNPQQS